MVSISKFGDSAIKFTFDDSDHYLMGDGEITVPVNGLILVLDESDMATFKKIDGDPFISFNIADSNFSSKSDLETFYKENMVGSTGGGGVTSGEVQTMIDESVSGLSDDISTVSGATESLHSAVTELSGQVNTDEKVTANALVDLDNRKLDASAYTPTDLSNYYTKSQTNTQINNATDGLLNAGEFYEYTASTDARISEDEEVTSAALNELNEALSGKQDTLIAGSGITIDSANTISCTVEGGGKAIEAGRGIAITTGATADTVSFNLPISATTAGTNSLQMFNTNTTNSDARNCLIAGMNNNVIAGWSYVFGGRNNVGNNCVSSIILGGGNNHQGNIGGVKIFGDNNKTSSLGGGEIIIGYNNNISGGANTSGNRIFIGEGLSAKNPKEIATGKYNVSHSGSTDSDKSIFSVGNGTSSAATHNAFEIRQNGDIYITSGGTDIKLQDNLGGGGGGVPESAFTAYTAATDARLAEDEEVTAAALNTLNTALGGFKLVSLTQAQYDALATKDASTLYLITNVVN